VVAAAAAAGACASSCHELAVDGACDACSTPYLQDTSQAPALPLPLLRRRSPASYFFISAFALRWNEETSSRKTLHNIIGQSLKLGRKRLQAAAPAPGG
jgi:hypothetical protein